MQEMSRCVFGPLRLEHHSRFDAVPPNIHMQDQWGLEAVAWSGGEDMSCRLIAMSTEWCFRRSGR